MAQTETGNDCEGDKSTRNYEDTETCPEKRPSPVLSKKAETGESRGAGSLLMELGSGAGVEMSSKKSRRKQRDPRRLGSEVVQTNMPVIGIKSEPREIDNDHGDALVMGNGAGDFDDDDDDDLFSSIRKKALSAIADEEVLSITRSESTLTSHAQRILNRKLDFGSQQNVKSGDVEEGGDNVQDDEGTSDCQSEPEDLSLGRRKRVDNRVPLAIPSLMTSPGTKASELRTYFANGLTSPMTKQLTGSTLPNKRLLYRDEGSDVPVSDDDRLKFSHLVYSEDYHEEKSRGRDSDHQAQALVVHHGPSFALLREHNIALDPDDCNSPELPYGHRKDGMVSPTTSTSSSSSTSPSSKTKHAHGHSPPRTYKNLTRSRRIVANARERNRVHTISAAFEGLRRAVPSYSHNQKLSKLAILRIACSYILALSKLADLDYSSDDQAQMTFEDCVDLCTDTLQAEGRSKRRKGQID